MATISIEPKIFTLVNTFTVEADKADAVVASLRDVTETVTRTLPGFIGASIHKSTDGEHVANYVQWKTLDDFQAMFADPRKRAHMAEVAALSVSVMPIAYTVVYVGEAPSRYEAREKLPTNALRTLISHRSRQSRGHRLSAIPRAIVGSGPRGNVGRFPIRGA